MVNEMCWRSLCKARTKFIIDSALLWFSPFREDFRWNFAAICMPMAISAWRKTFYGSIGMFYYQRRRSRLLFEIPIVYDWANKNIPFKCHLKSEISAVLSNFCYAASLPFISWRENPRRFHFEASLPHAECKKQVGNIFHRPQLANQGKWLRKQIARVSLSLDRTMRLCIVFSFSSCFRAHSLFSLPTLREV